MRKRFLILLLLILFTIPFMLFSENSREESETISKIDILFLIMLTGLSVITIFVLIIVIILIRILREKRKAEIVLKGMNMEERRKHLRDFTPTVVRVKQNLPGSGYKIMEFKNRDISKGGVFIIAENLSLFDLGEELEIIIKDGGKYFFEGKAIVIHTEAIFDKDSVKTGSGYGMMFLSSL